MMKQPNNNAPILDWALYYRSLGYSVIPIKYGTKQPCIKWAEFCKRIASEEEIKSWYQKYTDAQLGIVTGEISNLCVVDVDADKGGLDSLDEIDYPLTATAETGGGGIHLLYSYPKDATPKNSVSSIAPGIDLRANGGIIVVAPSLHPSGGHYKWLMPLDKAPSPLPELPTWAYEVPIQKDTNKDWSTDIGDTVMEGTRNDSATQFVGKLLSKLPQNKWETVGWFETYKWNQTVCAPPLEEDELRMVFNSIANREASQTSELIITPCTELLNRVSETQRFIIEKMIPVNSITSITADSGHGKSMLALIMAKHIASGERFLDRFDVKQGKVLIVDQEMDVGTLADRFKSVFEDDDTARDVHIVHSQSFKIDNESQREWLINSITEEGYAVLILDTFSTIHSSDDNSSQAMSAINQYLLEITRRTGVTILYLHHNRKSQKGEKYGQNTSRGSTEIIAKVSSHIMLNRKKTYLDEKTNHVITCLSLEQLKSRLPDPFAEFTIDISYDKKANKTSWRFGKPVDKDKKKSDEAKDEILSLLESSDEITVDHARTQLGIGESNIRVALKTLVKEGMATARQEKNGTKYYSLVKDTLPF